MRRRVLWAVAVVVLLVGGVSWQAVGLATELDSPLWDDRGAYVGSAACRKCHEDNDRSWHRTFHRTMTQEAREGTVLGDFSGKTLRYMGITARMQRTQAGGFEMAFSADGTGAHWRAEVVRTVGSHRYQQYLARDEDVFYRLPIAWDVAAKGFIHMNGAFLTPDPERPVAGAPIDNNDYNRHVTRWNDNCIFCHNVAANPGLSDSGEFNSEVAELGIACEACHGPGGEHVDRNGNPVRRYLLHLTDGRDPTIANPLRLEPARASAVCGRCHGQRLTKDIDIVHAKGDTFLPGEDLSRHSRPLFADTTLNGKPGVFAERFWPDGTARLTAYEYQGLLQSRCATMGDLTCNHCHSMHDGDPAGQLRPAARGNGMCTQCHTSMADLQALYDHTGHATMGTGSECVSCHMPKVVYGLVGIHRSHRIERPAPGATGEATHPDACVLCHTDRDRAWAARETTRMWPRMKGEGDDQSATRLLLAGDPIERAVAAAAFGVVHEPIRIARLPAAHQKALKKALPDPERERAHVAERVALLLDTMVRDDYPAVRQIAWRSVQSLLAAHAPTALAPVPLYVATDERHRRAQVVTALAAHLPEAFSRLTDPDAVAALRERARSMQIEIGE